MDLTPKQQTSEAIRQAETILIITGQHPSVDQVAAVMALAAILRKFGKKVSAIISDNPPAAVQMLDMGVVERGLGGLRDFVLKLDVTKVEVDKLRYEVEGGKLNIYLTPFKGSFAPSDVTFGYGAFHYDLAIALGVPTRARIDRIYEQNVASFEAIPMVNLDFHRSNENYGAVNLIEPNASSLCEMLVALSESLQSGIIDAEIATALLMGIVASTDRFTAAHTSPKSLTVAAQMMAAGARQQAVVRALYRDGKGDSRGGERGDRDRNSNSDRAGGDGRNTQGQQGGQRSGATQPSAPASPTQEPRVAPSTPVAPAPVRSVGPEAVPEQASAREEVPIIQPSHIELSTPEQAEPAPATQEAPLEPVAAVPPAQEPPPATQRREPEQSQDRPQTMPVADFAAAAEMFSRDASVSNARPEQEQS